MSGTYPTSPAPVAVKYSIISPTFVSVTHSGRIQSRDRDGAGRFQHEFIYPAMTRETFAPLWAFLVAQKGRAETFQVVNPAITRLGAGGGTPLVNGAHTSGDETIVTDGWPFSTTVLKAGDVVQFAGTGKVYTITTDVTSDGAGNATLPIVPGIVADVGDGLSVDIDSVAFDVSLSADLSMISVDHCNIHGGLVVTMQERA